MPTVAVNPDLLKWARETSGLSLEDAARKLQIGAARGIEPSNRLMALEEGDDQPTRSLLLRMSKHYRRPLISFYIDNPPLKGDRGEDFRRLPDDYSGEDDARVDALLRDVKTRQSLVRATIEDEDEAVQLPFVGSARIADGSDQVSRQIVDELQFDLDVFRRKPNISEAFSYLRAKTEAVGVFVLIIGDLGSHHTRMGVEIFRGFALADPIAPFIIVNHQDAKAAWSFTLLHELVHLWLGQTGISGAMAESRLEQFCNDVAGRILPGDDELIELNITNQLDFDVALDRISDFAAERNISRAMVAYKLYRLDRISFDHWNALRNEFRRQWFEFRDRQRRRSREQAGGPNHYVVKRYRAGPALVEIMSRMLGSGAITTIKAGKVLGVKPSRVYELIRQPG